MPHIDNAPQLTVYRDGLTNLNGEATRALGHAVAVLLLPPTTPGTFWQLVPCRQPAGAIVLAGRGDRGNVRFRAAALAAALYAAMPPELPGPLRLALETATDGRFQLLHKSVQQ